MRSRIIAIVIILVAGAGGFYAWFIHVPDPDPDWQVELAGATLDVNGLQREFSYFVPPGQAAGAPLVFVLHGSMGTAAGMRATTGYGFERLALEHGAIVVYPQGFERHWNDCRGSADYSANTRNIDDPAFFAAMIDWFVKQHGADRRRVLVTGLSNGGHMAYRLGLERPDLVLAIAPIAASLPAPSTMDCRASGTGVAVAIFNGTEDPVNPYEGGLVNVLGNSSRGEVLSSADTALFWARLSGYEDAPGTQELPDRDPQDGTTVTLQHWQQDGKPEVAHYIVEGGGHSVPSFNARMPRAVGRTSHDIDATAASWEFFARHWPAP
jgi:polyhydroxybutyrate depolymerase